MDGMSSDWKPSDLSDLRVSYDRGTLSQSDLLDTPLAQFESWLQDAKEAHLPDPNAMVLATVNGEGIATLRTVLLKGVDASGFRFFTNTHSRKAKAMADHPQVSLLFPWHALHRQVTVLGAAEAMPVAESEAYFQTRPRDSQLSAWASMQSEPIEDRSALEKRMEDVRQRFPAATPVPMPDSWGGFLIRPQSVEFWHGRASRLHDRLRFEAAPPASLDDPAVWSVTRYCP